MLSLEHLNSSIGENTTDAGPSNSNSKPNYSEMRVGDGIRNAMAFHANAFTSATNGQLKALGRMKNTGFIDILHQLKTICRPREGLDIQPDFEFLNGVQECTEEYIRAIHTARQSLLKAKKMVRNQKFTVNSGPLRFLEFPLEIRTRIYKLALPALVPLPLHCTRRWDETEDEFLEHLSIGFLHFVCCTEHICCHFRAVWGQVFQGPLGMLCKSVRNELKYIFWGQNEFDYVLNTRKGTHSSHLHSFEWQSLLRHAQKLDSQFDIGDDMPIKKISLYVEDSSRNRELWALIQILLSKPIVKVISLKTYGDQVPLVKAMLAHYFITKGPFGSILDQGPDYGNFSKTEKKLTTAFNRCNLFIKKHEKDFEVEDEELPEQNFHELSLRCVRKARNEHGVRHDPEFEIIDEYCDDCTGDDVVVKLATDMSVTGCVRY